MDLRKHAPHTERNREPILAHLKVLLAESHSVLEVASGSGQHAAYFASALEQLTWQPTDFDPGSLESIDAWAADCPGGRVRPAIQLDACSTDWPVDEVDAIFNANMIHISPFEVCLGLLEGAGRHLTPGGLLILYGPYRIAGEHTAPSNAAFDANLKQRDPSWGVRDLERVTAEAEARGLGFEARHDMPANNQLLVFRKR